MTEFSDTGIHPLNLLETRDGIPLRLTPPPNQAREQLISRLLHIRNLGVRPVSSKVMIAEFLRLESFTFRHYSVLRNEEHRSISEMFDDYYVASTKTPLKENCWFFFNPQEDLACLWLGYRTRNNILYISPDYKLEATGPETYATAVSDGGWIIRDGIIPHPTKQEISDACS